MLTLRILDSQYRLCPIISRLLVAYDIDTCHNVRLSLYNTDMRGLVAKPNNALAPCPALFDLTLLPNI